MRRSRNDVALGRQLTIGQHWQHPDRGVWRVRNVHRMDCLVDLEHVDTRQRDTLTFAQLRNGWTQPAEVEIDWDRPAAPAPRGLAVTSTALATPCPRCAHLPVYRVDDDLGALYQCPAGGCGWEHFIAWTDLEQPTRAPAGQPNVNSTTHGGPAVPLQLPTTPRARDGGPMTSRVLLVGHPKVGKSTCLATWAPKTTLILDTHAGTRLIPGDHYVLDIKSFTDFTQAVDLIVKGDHQFQTIGIDTVDDLYKLADQHAAAKHNKVAAGLVDFGKGTAEAEGLFRQQINRLLATTYGIWFLGHAETEQADKDVKHIPKLDKRVRTYVEGICDFIWFAQRIGPRAQIQTQPSARFGSGSRVAMPDPCPLDARAIYTAMEKGYAATATATTPPVEATTEKTEMTRAAA
jgi:predicted RNA-binding Zn-ribbon protein involved in translation (DUF1610 family)